MRREWVIAHQGCKTGAFIGVLPKPCGRAMTHEPCRKFPGPFRGAYCIWTTEGSRNPDTLYYFHGGNLTEEAWGEADYYPAMIRQAWRESGKAAPTVVSVSFGPTWLLVEKNSLPASGLLETFVTRLLPMIEKEVGGTKGRRLLLGESMGGFNSAALALKAGNLFSKVGILCPGIVNLSPFAKHDEIEAFLKRTGADRQKLDQIQKIAAAFIPDEASWKRESALEDAHYKLYPE